LVKTNTKENGANERSTRIG